MRILTIAFLLSISLLNEIKAQKTDFNYLDVFALEYAGDPQISPDGEYVVYRRIGFDIMKDRSKGNLWIINTSNPTNHYKLTSREVNESNARWSPTGDRIVFSSSTEEGSEIYIYWLKSGATAKLTQLENSPSNITWSPDGNFLAFTMDVKSKPPVVANMPQKPEGAEWGKDPRITDRLKHEADGSGYIEPGHTHIFSIPAEGGYPRQLTSGDFQHDSSLSWSPDGQLIFFSANRNEDWEYDFRNSEIYSVNAENLKIKQYTNRQGPDYSPVVSSDGKYIAYLGNEDKMQAYQVTDLHIMNIDGSNQQAILEDLDRDVEDIKWDEKSKGLYYLYNDLGLTKIGYTTLSGKATDIVDNVGGTSLGRPYSGGSYSVSNNGRLAFTYSEPQRPADVGLVEKGGRSKKLTSLNEDILAHRNLGKVEEIWYKSSVDTRDIQGWIVYPPDYDQNKKYPLIVENHGGPISNYGPFFSAEVQLFAAHGYIVFYPNPRGSTSYGEEFGNLLYNNYPGEDYNDVMDGVEVLIKRGIAHEDQLFVTGGSAGGIMTAWIIGKNNRFEAAVVAKPVMNWISKTLVADNYYGYANSRYPGQPWENFETYWKFSPLSLVANIETPTMVMVGMDDLRTPPSEAKQLYHALKLRKIKTVLVEIPDASHNISSRPSNLITKVTHILAWFDKYKEE